MGEVNSDSMGAGNLKGMLYIKTGFLRPFFSLKSRMLIYFGLPLIVVIVILMQGCFKGESEQDKTAPKKDLLKHPIYSKYEFSKSENVINIGHQSITLTGPVIEAMRRDAVFRDTL